MSSKQRLDQIATLRGGYHFRGSITADPAGEYRVLQAKDLDAELRFNPASLTRVAVDSTADAYLLAQGDILFLARGNRQYAVPILEPLERTLAPNHFLIVRPDHGTALSQYVAWYLNQPPAQAVLRSLAQGSNVHFISVKQMAEFELPIPPMEVQQTIVTISTLSEREQQLMRALMEERGRLTTALCLTAARKDSA